ncbi:hypothetical protein WA026_005567 [Henosepilachna vigintioctopunctata]|uniref:Protein yellow n=1 Tax=Henosepilachna vigintioctopunctata TaxID=420089 RepID=A0AAW1U3B0_9CUCU
MCFKGRNLVSFAAIWILVLISATQAVQKLQKKYEWKYMDYLFDSPNDKIKAFQTQRYIPENNLPVGMEVFREKLFVTVPRWRPGIPSTLNYIPLNDVYSNSPPLIPYPDWKSNELGNCETGLTTVYRIKVDECNRLWVLDTGTYGIGNTTQQLCPYAINIFDLETNQRIKRFEIPSTLINQETFIANIAVDIEDRCDNAYAYLSDELAYGLIVYSLAEDKAWKFRHGYFFPDPLAGNFTIDGYNFNWDLEGIFGIALSPKYSNGEKLLYFSPLASNTEFAVPTSILKDITKVSESYSDFRLIGSRGPKSHLTSKVMDEYGIQLFNLIDRNAIGCWNSRFPYTPKNLGIVDKDDIGLIFPSDVKIDAYRNVWVLSDRMSNFLEAPGGLNFNEVNFRIYFAPMDVLIHGTVCDSSPNKYRGYQIFEH